MQVVAKYQNGTGTAMRLFLFLTRLCTFYMFCFLIALLCENVLTRIHCRHNRLFLDLRTNYLLKSTRLYSLTNLLYLFFDTCKLHTFVYLEKKLLCYVRFYYCDSFYFDLNKYLLPHKRQHNSPFIIRRYTVNKVP